MSEVRTWSSSPFARTVDVAKVAERREVIAQDTGEATVIYESGQHSGWLVKLYKPGFPKQPESVLDRLIALPARMSEVDRAVVDTSIAWPVARVVDGGRTAGVITARAPDEFFTEIGLPGGRTRRRALEIDYLMLPEPEYDRLRLTGPEPSRRLVLTRELLRVGELFERHDLVYGDWSYSNAFWTQDDDRVFVIDVDACGFGGRTWVETVGWSDPLVKPDHTGPGGREIDVTTDRYKLALLATRCLTGVRGDPSAALTALPDGLRNHPLVDLLRASITARRGAERPTAGRLLQALENAMSPLPSHGVSTAGDPARGVSGGAGAGNVTGWTPLRHSVRQRSDRPAAPAAAGRAAGSTRPGTPAQPSRHSQPSPRRSQSTHAPAAAHRPTSAAAGTRGPAAGRRGAGARPGPATRPGSAAPPYRRATRSKTSRATTRAFLVIVVAVLVLAVLQHL